MWPLLIQLDVLLDRVHFQSDNSPTFDARKRRNNRETEKRARDQMFSRNLGKKLFSCITFPTPENWEDN